MVHDLHFCTDGVKQSKEWIHIAHYNALSLWSAQIWPMCNKGITQFYLPPTHEPCLPLLPSRKASPPLGQYQLILLGEQRHIGVKTFPEFLHCMPGRDLNPHLLIASPMLYWQRHDTTGLCQLSFLWMLTTADSELHIQHVPVNKIWRQIVITPQCWRRQTQLVGSRSDYGTRKIILKKNCWVCGHSKDFQYRLNVLLTEKGHLSSL